MAAKTPEWARRKGESEPAYDLYLAYRDMGIARTIESVHGSYIKPGGGNYSLSHLQKLASAHKWVDRCRAWDNHLQAKRDAESAADAALWERRRLKEVERVYALSQQLAEVVQQGLKFPLSTRTIESKVDAKGNVIELVTIEPARWTMRDLATLADLSVRMAAGALAAKACDPTQLSDAELMAIASAASPE